MVYCNPAGKVVRKGQTKLPVTEVFVCYCFEHKRGDLRRDLEAKGTTDIPTRIRQGVKEGRCDCEPQNPQGACCLGNAANAIKAIQAEIERQ